MLLKILKKIKKYGLLKVFIFSIKKIRRENEVRRLKKYGFKKKVDLKNFKTNINFFYSINEKEIFRNFYENNSFLKLDVIKSADKIIKHKFDLLGSDEVELEENIIWNKDFKSGFIWENKFYRDIKIIDLENNADVKVPWELSRFQHLFTLGKAYWITGNLKYFEEAKEQILDWIEKNPIYYGVNWTCTMDVAIRAVNLIFFYFHFQDLIEEDKKFFEKFNECLYQHGEYIYLNLEKSLELANNHYLSNLTGLIFLGIYFKNLKEKNSNKWLNFSLKEIEKEMFIQNNEDGTNYETSTSYHRLVIELMFYPTLLLKINGLKFSREYENRLEKMIEFLAKITKSNGKIPLIGDVDNGRLVILSNYYNWEVNDARHIISLGGEYFDNILLKEIGASEKEDRIWIFNSQKFYKENFFKKSIAFEDGGYYLLQSKRIYCLIRCGELSLRGQGGHSHNDQLSIELNVDGKDFFIDTGTGVYTANKNIRNLFRSTKMHNTVSITGIEQNDFDKDKLFEMKEESFGKCLDFSEKAFKGIHYGYKTKIGSTHIREVVLDNESLNLIDLLDNNIGTINFNLDSTVKITKLGENNIVLRRDDTTLQILIDDNSTYEIKHSEFSKKYGKIEKTKKIEIYFKNKSEIKIELNKKMNEVLKYS